MLVIILRGHPCSGKTTVAEKLYAHLDSRFEGTVYYVSADLVRLNADNVRNHDAHVECFTAAMAAFRAHAAAVERARAQFPGPEEFDEYFDAPRDALIVDNTHMMWHDVTPYLALAHAHGAAAVLVVEVFTTRQVAEARAEKLGFSAVHRVRKGWAQEYEETPPRWRGGVLCQRVRNFDMSTLAGVHGILPAPFSQPLKRSWCKEETARRDAEFLRRDALRPDFARLQTK